MAALRPGVLLPGDDDDPAAELAYARRHFFLPRRFRDPFGNTTTVTYDRYDLLVSQTRDPLGNLVTAGERDAAGRLTADGNDYRVLAPRLVSDPNRNRAAVAFDTLGRVGGTAVMGKPEERLGDSLDGFDPDLPAAAVDGVLRRPVRRARTELLGQATTRVLYDLDAYRRTRQAAAAARRGGRAGPRDPRQRPGAGPADEDPALVRLLRRLRPGDPAQGPGRARAGGRRRPGRRAPLDRQRLDGLQQQGPAGPQLRAVLHRARPAFEFAPRQRRQPGAVLRPGRPGRGHPAPGRQLRQDRLRPVAHRTPGTSTTPCCSTRATTRTWRGYAGRYLAVLGEQPGGWATWYAQRIGGALGRGRAARRRADRAARRHPDPVAGWTRSAGPS